MIKKLFIMCSTLLFAFGLSSCDDESTSVATVESVTVNGLETLELGVSTELQRTFTATVGGTNSPSQEVTWSTSNQEIATIDGGLLTLIAAGEVNVIAKSVADQTVSGTKAVTITAQSTDQKLEEAIEALNLTGTNAVTTAIDLPTTGLHGTTITWVSSNPNVISNGGAVIVRPFTSDLTVSFVATISLQEKSSTRSFDVTVLQQELIWIADDIIAQGVFDRQLDEVSDKDAALIQGDVFTRFGDYRSEFNDGFTTGIEIFLDPENFEENEFFVYDVALNNASGTYLTSMQVHVRKTENRGLRIGTQGLPGAIGTIVNKPEAMFYNRGASDAFNMFAVGETQQAFDAFPAWPTNPVVIEYMENEYVDLSYEIKEAGWFTITVSYWADQNGYVFNDVAVYNSDFEVVHNLSLPATAPHVVDGERFEYHINVDGIFDEETTAILPQVGGNRYGWFALNTVAKGFAARSVWIA